MSLVIKLDLEGNIKKIDFSYRESNASEIRKFLNSLEGRPLKYILENKFWDEIKTLNSPYLQSRFYYYCNNHYFSHLENDGVSNEKILCRCVSYLEKTFYKFLKENPTVEESEVAGLIQVGAGCGSCIRDVHEIFTSLRNRRPTPFDITLKLQEFLNEQNLLDYSILSCSNNKIMIKSPGNSFSDGLIYSFMKDFSDIKVIING